MLLVVVVGCSQSDGQANLETIQENVKVKQQVSEMLRVIKEEAANGNDGALEAYQEMERQGIFKDDDE